MRRPKRASPQQPQQQAQVEKVQRFPPAPPASSAAVRAVMRANRRWNTTPELAVRRLLHASGLRYFVHRAVPVGGLRVRPDVVFPRMRVALFIDGCFWHGCPQHGTRPRVNSTYWEAKLTRNRARDERVNAALRSEGWHVIRAWEHEEAAEVVKRVAAAVTALGRARRQ